MILLPYKYPKKLQELFDSIKRKHRHNWLWVARTDWRDGYGKKYMIEYYKCECGGTKPVTVPWESYEL